MTIHRLPRAPWGESRRSAVAYSLVIPVYNEEESLPLLHQAITGVMSSLPGGWEVIYVDDGSRDRSPDVLEDLAAADTHVRVVQFRRNFGQTAATSAGIDHARGDVLIFMDADLQNDPADIPRLLDKLDEGYDVVSGWRIKRQDAYWTRKAPSVMANWLISRVTGVHLHDYGCSLKAYRRDVISEINLYGEMHRF
ncbi:MAG: glycosyltransferase family 2 protein, partial [Chloroflexi bacterium]|nr:glycosyltransferase family 2 protein [Chloroflexota bacterium]